MTLGALKTEDSGRMKKTTQLTGKREWLDAPRSDERLLSDQRPKEPVAAKDAVKSSGKRPPIHRSAASAYPECTL